MLRTRLLIALVALLSPLAVVVSADASVAAPTLSGPSIVPYYASVTLTGTTPHPNEAVTVYLLRTVGSSHNTYPLTSDATGHYHLTYRATVNWKWFADAAGQRSSEGTTTLVTATCTVSGPAFTSVPLLGQSGIPFPPLVVEFSQTRGEVWAGSEYLQTASHFYGAVISWTPATHHVTALDAYDYADSDLDGLPAYGNGAVSVVGVGSNGMVVASIDTPKFPASLGGYPQMGMVYVAGKKYRLKGESGWTSINPLTVTTDNRIIGVASIGKISDFDQDVVQWTSPTAAPQVLRHLPLFASNIASDGAGDISYRSGADTVVRLSDGVTLPLIGPGDDINAAATTGSGPYLFGGGSNGSLQWTIDPHQTTGEVVGTLVAGLGPYQDTAIERADVRGDMVVGINAPQHFRTAAGAWVALPPQVDQAAGDADGNQAIAANGTMAFTSATDQRVHFMSCH